MKASKSEGAYLLCIETATVVGSVALFLDDQLQGSIEYHRAKSHARLLMPMIRTLLNDMEVEPSALSGIAVSKGPGSYTGLRVGVSTAKGLCMALDKPLLSLSSLEALAWQLQPLAQRLGAWLCPMIDARRMEVYCALYDANMGLQQPIQAKIVETGTFKELLQSQRVIFAGDGAAKCRELLEASPQAIVLPEQLSTARSMGPAVFQAFQRGQFEDLTTFEPFYLKDFVATKPRNRLKG